MIDNQEHPALMPLENFATEVVRERLAQAKEEEARKEAARDAVLGHADGPLPNHEKLKEMLSELWGVAFQVCLDTLYDLACPGWSDFDCLAFDVEDAYKQKGELEVKLLDYLRQFPRLAEEVCLRDDLTQGYLLNALHRLQTLAAIQKTGKDPESEPEKVQPFGDEEGRVWRSF